MSTPDDKCGDTERVAYRGTYEQCLIYADDNAHRFLFIRVRPTKAQGLPTHEVLVIKR